MDNAVQASFNSGEWAPALNARVDLSKYKSGAALAENFFVDYRGGVSSRPGTQYVLQAYKSESQVRLISFQAAFSVGYAIEIGDEYMRFFFAGSPVLNDPVTITNATQANPCVLTIPGNTYTINDWIFVDGIVGMTQLNNRFFRIINVAGDDITIGIILDGSPVDSTGYSAYISGGTSQSIYTIPSPYRSADDLRLIKFAQSVNQMILCHPDYETYVLTLISAINWTLVPIVIGSTAAAPQNLNFASTLGDGNTTYSYGVTSIDASGQESAMENTVGATVGDIRTTTGSIQISWDPVPGAVGYNIYESNVSYFGVVPFGVQYGFVGTCKGTQFIDSNIAQDFSTTPPIPQNPFVGAGVDFVTVTSPGTYTTVPGVTFIGTAIVSATGVADLQVQGTPMITSGGTGFAIGDTVSFSNGLVVRVDGEAGGVISSWSVVSPGSITAGSTPSNPITQTSTSGSGMSATATATWGVGQVLVLTAGAGYTAVPTVQFSSGSAAATATLQSDSNGNPTVPSFFQQRLILAGQPGAPQTFYMSRPGAFYNFDISSPSQPDDSISGTLVSGTLNSIKSIVSVNAGMLVLTDKGSWIINGGASGTAVSPSTIVANAQSFVGANDVPPIVANYDVLYVPSKGSGVRDLAFNIYFNTFTGTDISILSSHLFFNRSIVEWAWAEQPYYVAWAVRDDGWLLSLTFLKEQDFVGWTHSITDGLYKSVTAVTEATSDAGTVDAVYSIAQREIEGNTVQYIERFAERSFPGGLDFSWCVDSALQYNAGPATTFSGMEHLAGNTCTGLADGVVIPPFTMPADGVFTLSSPASVVTVGLGFTCKLQTLALELGEPTVQGKVKKINAVDVRVDKTLGLKIGSDFDHLTPMKDLIIGNVSSMLTGQSIQVIGGLVTGDARTWMDPTYTVPGQYCIQQDQPLPASILGVFPSYTIGDTR